MSHLHETTSGTEIFAKPEAMLRVPVGLASPLWCLFAGAAMSGSAWWWMTRFARPENLEALFGAAEARAVKAATLPLPAAEAVVAAAIETLDAVEGVTETVAESTIEAVIEADVAPVTAAEAMEAALDEPAPVGGESAPISPFVAALSPEPEADAATEDAAAARPRKKVGPKAD